MNLTLYRVLNLIKLKKFSTLLYVYDVELEKLFVSMDKWNVAISPREKINCREIVTNENDSEVVNADPLFDLFSTELFDTLYESIQKMFQQFDIVAEVDSDDDNAEKAAT